MAAARGVAQLAPSPVAVHNVRPVCLSKATMPASVCRPPTFRINRSPSSSGLDATGNIPASTAYSSFSGRDQISLPSFKVKQCKRPWAPLSHADQVLNSPTDMNGKIQRCRGMCRFPTSRTRWPFDAKPSLPKGSGRCFAQQSLDLPSPVFLSFIPLPFIGLPCRSFAHSCRDIGRLPRNCRTEDRIEPLTVPSPSRGEETIGQFFLEPYFIGPGKLFIRILRRLHLFFARKE